MIARRLFVGGFSHRIKVTIAVLLAAAVIMPILNLALPPSNPFHVPAYLVALIGKYLTFALLALALDLVWGYCGIL